MLRLLQSVAAADSQDVCTATLQFNAGLPLLVDLAWNNSVFNISPSFEYIAIVAVA